MRLAAAYSVFNSCELLIKSIEQIYNYVDLIIISYQEVSNVGNKISNEDLLVLEEIASYNDSKIKILKYIPDLKLNPKENERRKLQGRIDFCKAENISHYFGAAADHYFKPKEFAAAKKRAIELDVDITFTKMFTYYKKPIYRLDPIEDYVAPFISKIYPETKVVTGLANYKERVDPAVRISPAFSFYTFKEEEIMLHHFSMIREDIYSKFNNAAAAQNWPEKIPGFIEEYNKAKPGDSISYFKGRKLIEVENIFNF